MNNTILEYPRIYVLGECGGCRKETELRTNWNQVSDHCDDCIEHMEQMLTHLKNFDE